MTRRRMAKPMGGRSRDVGVTSTNPGGVSVVAVPTDPLPVAITELRARLGATADRARDYLAAARAASTRRAYRHDWAAFAAWCAGHGLPALPAAPETVALYLADLADQVKEAADGRAVPRYAINTLQRRLAGIAAAHKEAGQEPPTRAALVRRTWAGIRRTRRVAPAAKAPIATDLLRAMVAALPATVQGRRDRALLLVGFAGAFRRSELVALDRADLGFDGEGLTITLRASKTDQEGAGRAIGIPFGERPDTCPVRALRAWLAAAGIDGGAVFRPVTRHDTVRPRRLTDHSVALIVKRAATAVGLDPAAYAGHSLRAGLATAAARAGVAERDIMRQTGHRSVEMVRRYIREGSLFRDNPAGRVGL
jgi:integrase